ncbi:MAG: hypothetical protein ACI4CC_08505 [Lachnospiraceae bacterium]
MNRKTNLSMPVGGSSLLVIFAVLSLTVFALLVLATVKADSRMSVESTNAIKDYYEADLEAERILGELRAGKEVEGVTKQEGIYAFSCEISDTQVLSVIAAIDGEKYEIYQWKAVPSKEWSPEEYIKVWEPEE